MKKAFVIGSLLVVLTLSLGGTSSTYWFWTMDSTSVNSRSCS